MNLMPFFFAVSSRRRDPRTTIVPKYVSANGDIIENKPVIYLNPDVSALTPLALFLWENAKGDRTGFNTSCNINKVSVYLNNTVADKYRAIKIKNCEQLIKAYDLENELEKIEDWLFSIIEPILTDTRYLNREAEIIAKIAKYVVIGDARFDIGRGC